MKTTTPTKSQMIRMIGTVIGVKHACKCCNKHERIIDSIIQLQHNIEQSTASDRREIDVKKSLAISRN